MFNLNNFYKGPLGNATYQILDIKVLGFPFQKKMIFNVFYFLSLSL